MARKKIRSVAAAVAAVTAVLLLAGCAVAGQGETSPDAASAPREASQQACPSPSRDHLANGFTRSQLLEQRVGFGRHAGTGASDWPEVTVTSLEDAGPGTLREALGTGERWITFERGLEGTIVLSGKDAPLRVPSDVVVDGRGADVTIRQSGDVHRTSEHVGFSITGGARNVVITNLTIGTASDGVQVHGSGRARGPRDIWLHHLTLEVFSIEDEGIGIGALAESDAARPKNVTVSWSRFDGRGTGRGMILGGDTHPLTAPDYVTLHHNWFHDVQARQPLVQAAKLHQFNNWHDGWGPADDRAVSIGTDAQVYLEANVIDDTRGKGVFNWPDDYGSYGNLRAEDNLSDAVIVERNPEMVFRPSTYYPYETDHADQRLRTLLQRRAGARPSGGTPADPGCRSQPASGGDPQPR